MNPLQKSIAAVAMLGVIGVALTATLFAQDRNVNPANPVNSLVAPGKSDRSPAQDLFDESVAPGKAKDSPLLRFANSTSRQAEYASALDVFRRAQDGAEKETAKATLRKQLVEIFDADMKARKAQADEIESRLKKLRDQYQSREAARDSIIDLQIQVLEKDADGLGFPKGADADGSQLERWSRNRPTATTAQSPWRSPEQRELPLVEHLKRQPALIEELKKRGHFVISDDGKKYAYVLSDDRIGTSSVHLQDASTGKLLAMYQANGIVAEIRFQEGGVAVRMPEGKFEVRIPLEISNTKPVSDAKSDRNANQLNTHDLGGGELEGYSRIRKQYLDATSNLKNWSESWTKNVEKARKEKPDITEEELQAKFSNIHAPNLRTANSQMREAEMLLETKLKLLALDAQSAKASFILSEAEFATAQSINSSKPGVVNELELRRLHAQLEKSKIELMRAETIYDLFQSIEAEGKSKPESKSKPEAAKQ